MRKPNHSGISLSPKGICVCVEKQQWLVFLNGDSSVDFVGHPSKLDGTAILFKKKFADV